MRIELHRKFPGQLLLATALSLCLCLLLPVKLKADPAARKLPADASLSAALCQVVYPLDQSPEEGYRYMFLGNGFFVNDQGYVITAAHLLSSFRYGGAPYVLVGPPEGPARMLEAPIAAVDWDHDVAVLHVTPNPFQDDKKIAYLRLSTELPGPGAGVLEDSLIPPDEKDAHTSAPPREDFSQGEIIDYEFYREKDAAEQLLLFNQEVIPGQSGAPLVSAGSHAVVGVIVGRWLHPAVAPSGPQSGQVTVSPGAALRIHYAIGLLEQLRVPWDMVAESSGTTPGPAPAQPAAGASLPGPLSLVGTPYPPQALFGGEVLLDAQVNADGRLSDVRVIAGSSPFLDAALGAVHTWSFVPARKNGRMVESRIGIVFQFPQSFLPRLIHTEHKYDQPLANTESRAALPVLTVEPDYPAGSIAEGSVILYGSVDTQGHLTSLSAVRDVPSLTASAEAAVRQWQFAPGLNDGAPAESAIVVVTTYRRPAK